MLPNNVSPDVVQPTLTVDIERLSPVVTLRLSIPEARTRRGVLILARWHLVTRDPGVSVVGFDVDVISVAVVSYTLLG